MKQDILASGEFYHLFNRANSQKDKLFFQTRNYYYFPNNWGQNKNNWNNWGQIGSNNWGQQITGVITGVRVKLTPILNTK